MFCSSYVQFCFLSVIHLGSCRCSNGGGGGVLSPCACVTFAKENQDTCSECFPFCVVIPYLLEVAHVLLGAVDLLLCAG